MDTSKYVTEFKQLEEELSSGNLSQTPCVFKTDY